MAVNTQYMIRGREDGQEGLMYFTAGSLVTQERFQAAGNNQTLGNSEFYLTTPERERTGAELLQMKDTLARLNGVREMTPSMNVCESESLKEWNPVRVVFLSESLSLTVIFHPLTRNERWLSEDG